MPGNDEKHILSFLATFSWVRPHTDPRDLVAPGEGAGKVLVVPSCWAQHLDLTIRPQEWEIDEWGQSSPRSPDGCGRVPVPDGWTDSRVRGHWALEKALFILS